MNETARRARISRLDPGVSGPLVFRVLLGGAAPTRSEAACLSARERARANAIPSEQLRSRFVRCRAALRHILGPLHPELETLSIGSYPEHHLQVIQESMQVKRAPIQGDVTGFDPRHFKHIVIQGKQMFPTAYDRIQSDWPWIGVANTWDLKRSTDAWEQNGQPEAYFRLLAPDFSPQPVYDAIKAYMHSIPDGDE